MPTYDYKCSACGHKFEEFHSITKKLETCPECGKNKLVRGVGGGGGFILKGSGFYQNDYRSRQYHKDRQYSNRQDRKADRLSKAKYKAQERAAKTAVNLSDSQTCHTVGN